MKKNIKTFLTLVVLAIFLSLGLNVPVSAKKAFSLSPMFEKISLNPGEVYEGSIDVSNPANSGEVFYYSVDVVPYSLHRMEGSDDDYSGVDYETKTDRNMMADWTTIVNPTGSLKPNEQRKIYYTIKVPASAPGGGQYMALMVGEDQEYKDGDGAFAEIMQMAHVVYADLPGDVIEEGEILLNEIPSFITTNSLATSVTIRNNGNVHADAECILQVWPFYSDEEIYTNEENPETIFVMPNTEKYYVQKHDLPPFGIFRVRQTVKIFGEESVVEKMVIVCPVWLLFIILFLVILIIIWFCTRSKARKGSKKAKTAE